MNRYPLWKYLLAILLLAAGVFYALPNLYGDLPALQISTTQEDASLETTVLAKIKAALVNQKITPLSIQKTARGLVIAFATTDQQAAAQEIVKTVLGPDTTLTVALDLQPTTPAFLTKLGAHPMRLGLDLRGGVHFLLTVDVQEVFERIAHADVKRVTQELHQQHIRYTGLSSLPAAPGPGMTVFFRRADARAEAYRYLTKALPEYQWNLQQVAGRLVLQGVMTKAQYNQLRQNIIDQSMTILRNRVNELGISEAMVTQQGSEQMAIDLPGMQDPAQAQNILGKTATVEFHLVDVSQDARSASITGMVPVDDILVFNEHHQAFLLKKPILLDGSSISNATANYADEGPEVAIHLASGAAVTRFNTLTAHNIGQLLATLYVETRSLAQPVPENGSATYTVERRVINAATINSALGNSFRITGMGDIQAASELALLLRAGALPAPIHIVEERTIGPSLGQQNIDQGLLSVEIGFAAVVLFMALYYRTFGWIANAALGMNLLLIVAAMSLLGAVLTLPGIAAMVLTVGMAVDANVLIFERIREELRLGASPQAAIFTGYERAFITIVDANVTTLIIAIVLFSLGSGAVKGFAIILTLGLITSMITSILCTRALVNIIYGRPAVQRLSIGINVIKPEN